MRIPSHPRRTSLLKTFYPASETRVSSGSLCIANHHAIFRNTGIAPVEYPYYHPATRGLDYDGFLGALRDASPRSVFLLHACAHNPTGVDPNEQQWTTIADIMLKKGHYGFFDFAYQGFASGDLDRDAFPARIQLSFLLPVGAYGDLRIVVLVPRWSRRLGEALCASWRANISLSSAFLPIVVCAFMR